MHVIEMMICVAYTSLMESKVTPLLERNRRYSESGIWKTPPRLPFLPFAGLYIVTCVDPRTDPADFLGIQFGEAIVARTVGGRVNELVLRDLAYISYLVESKAPEGPFFEVTIIHHTNCGTRLLEDAQLRDDFSQKAGYSQESLLALPVTDPDRTVAEDVARIKAFPNVSSRFVVSGFVYDTQNALLRPAATVPC